MPGSEYFHKKMNGMKQIYMLTPNFYKVDQKQYSALEKIFKMIVWKVSLPF